MHVDREIVSAKFWLDPDVSLEENHGYSRRELRDIERIARDGNWKNEYEDYRELLKSI